jgi:acetoin utilization deacetylase AcuC-like enzyme
MVLIGNAVVSHLFLKRGITIMKEKERKLLLISIECWFKELEDLIEWIKSSGASREAIAKTKQVFSRYENVFRHNPYYAELSDSIKFEIYNRNRKLLKFSLRQDRSKRLSPSSDELTVTVQVPCDNDLQAMKALPAGGFDRQKERLKKIKAAVYDQVAEGHIVETQSIKTKYWIDRLPWRVLCEAIRSNDRRLVELAFRTIPEDNPVLRALLQAHDRDYILDIIYRCANLSAEEYAFLVPGDPDVVIGQRTFEVLIFDLITTLEQRQKLNISIGLPTHHAYRNQAAGFCLLNKIAIIMAYEQSQSHEPIHHVIIGLDVNRDNGLSSIIMNRETDCSCLHLDVNDSRVYPWHTVEDIEAEWHGRGTRYPNMTTWQRGFRSYHNIDLARFPRKGAEIHPAIKMVLSELEASLKAASESQQPVMIYLPTGWDSHEKETAACGQMIDNLRWLSASQSHSCRLTDKDFDFFNQELFKLIRTHESIITRVYWQLEGGYTDEVNFRQVASLAKAWHISKYEASPSASSSVEPFSSSSDFSRVTRARHR